MNPNVALALIMGIVFSCIITLAVCANRVHASIDKHLEAAQIYSDSARAHLFEEGNSAFRSWQTLSDKELEIAQALIDIKLP